MTHPHSRTVLFAPGVSLRMMGKALAGSADAVVLDVEDSVPSADKPAARVNIAEALAQAELGSTQVRTVRINHEDGWEAADLDLVRGLLDARSIHGVMLPKVSNAGEVDSFIAALGRDAEVWAVATETPEGVVELTAIAAHPAVVALCWGPEDLSVLMGSFGAREPDGRLRPVYEWVRWQALIAARAADIQALDTVFVDIGDTERLEAESLEAARAGFSGKMAIHPGQLPIIEQAFRPPADIVDWSRRLLAQREASGLGAFTFDGKMVDQPHFKLAARMIEREEAWASDAPTSQKDAVT